MDRPKYAAAKRFLGVLLALTIALTALPGAGLALERASLTLPDYPTPEVPACARVPDDYFKGAVLVGDSLASAFEIHGVIPELSTLTDVGLSARTAGSTARRYDVEGRKRSLLDALALREPRIVYIWLGNNGLDIKDAEGALADMEGFLDKLIAHLPEDTLYYVLSLTPLKAKAQERHKTYTNERILAYNAGLRRIAEERNIYFLNTNPLLRNEQGYLDDTYGTGDGIHLRAAAYDVLADFLYTNAIPLPKEET